MDEDDSDFEQAERFVKR